MIFPHVIIEHPELGAPEGIGGQSWHPVPGSRLWGGNVVTYLRLHVSAAVGPIGIILLAFAVLVAVALAPLWI